MLSYVHGVRGVLNDYDAGVLWAYTVIASLIELTNLLYRFIVLRTRLFV